MTTQVFKKNLEAYLAGYHLIVNRGGQGSGKTYAIMQMLAAICLRQKLFVTTSSYAYPHLRDGAQKDWREILTRWRLNSIVHELKGERSWVFPNGSRVEFFGIEGQEQRGYSVRPDIVYINELNRRIAREVFIPFYSRVQRSIIVDFNPAAPFWIQDVMADDKKAIEIVSTYLDNPYLAQKEREFLESRSKLPLWAEWYKVYGLGEWGTIEGTILPNWRFGEFDNTLPQIYGIDFGVRDPDALVKVAIDKNEKRIFVDELLYESGQSTEMLITRLNKLVPNRALIVADAASTRTIDDLARAGLNIVPAYKVGKVESLKRLRDFEIVITERSYHLQKELLSYVWLDRAGEIPKDGDDHLIDAMHYAARYLLEGQEVKYTKAPMRANKL